MQILNTSSAVAEMGDGLGMQCGQHCHCQPWF